MCDISASDPVSVAQAPLLQKSPESPYDSSYTEVTGAHAAREYRSTTRKVPLTV